MICNMKKIALLFTLFCFSLGVISCNFDSVSKNFEWKDVSEWKYSVTGNPYFSFDKGIFYASVTSGTWSNKISNWVVSNYFNSWNDEVGNFQYDYDSVNPKGFICDVKLGKNMNRAGIEWFNKGSYDQYWFTIYSNGDFEILYDDVTNKTGWSKIIKIPSEESGVKPNKFNNLKIFTTNNDDVKILINNRLVYTIAAQDFLIEPEKVAIAFQPEKGIEFTENNPAEAFFKVNKFLIEKE